MTCCICLSAFVAQTPCVTFPCGHQLHTKCFAGMLDSQLAQTDGINKVTACCVCRATVLPPWSTCVDDVNVVEQLAAKARTFTTHSAESCGLVYYAACGRKAADRITLVEKMITTVRRLDTLRGTKVTLAKRLKRLKEARVRMQTKARTQISKMLFQARRF